MIKEKRITISEAQNKIKKLNHQLELYLTKKKINYAKTQPSAIKYKEVITNSIYNNSDPFTMFMIKDEECDTHIYSIRDEIIALEKYINDELTRMIQTDDIELIEFFRTQRDQYGKRMYKWKDIDKILHRGEGYSKVKYSRYKKKDNV